MAGGLHVATVLAVDEAVAVLFLSSGTHFVSLFSSQLRALQDFLCVSGMLPFSFVVHTIRLSEAFQECTKAKLLC